jgi:hypothetical protein
VLLTTKDIHKRAAQLGHALGFDVSREVSDSLLRLRLDKCYRPRIDLLWSLPLDTEKCKTLAWALDRKLNDGAHLPVVGIEVEGTTPSTKTMEADTTNLAALGMPLGLLVVSEKGEKNIYRRAARVIRSVRRSFGDLRLLPMEADWFDPLLKKSWPPGPSPVPIPKRKLPAGGETLVWSAATRDRLRAMGEQAGFVVAEPYVPPVLAASYSLLSQQWSKRLSHTCDPLTRTVKQMSKVSDLYTESEIDLAWLMPLPAALPAFLQEVMRLDPCLREFGMVFPDLWTHIPIVAFELESKGGKHAGGGLMNLSTYGVLGVAVAPNSKVSEGIASALRTYQPTLGLRNVYVKVVSDEPTEDLVGRAC